MKNRLAITAVLALLALGGCRNEGYVQVAGYAQGGTWSVKYKSAGKAPARVKAGIEAILEDIDTTLSGYNRKSLLSRLNDGDTIRPTPMLIELYDRSRAFWEETGGALDVAAGPLFDIWGFGFRNDSLPAPEKVRKALEASGMGRLVPKMEDALDSAGRLHGSWLRWVVTDAPSGTPSDAGALPQLNFNAVAQGFSADTVASYLKSLGITDMLVDIGEIWCSGENPSGKPWSIGIDRPTDGNDTPGADLDGIWLSSPQRQEAAPAQPELPGQGIVTSGNYRKFYIRDGRKYAHTVDPRSGYPVSHGLLSATVVAPTAEAADAYATYCMVIGLEEARSFIESRYDLEGFLVFSTPDGGMEEWHSKGFKMAQE